MSNPTGPLTANELDTLSTLLRRLLEHDEAQPWRSEILAAQGVAGKARDAKREEPAMTAGPNPIPVSQLLNDDSYDRLGIAPWNS